MRTSQKRVLFKQFKPQLFNQVQNMIERKQFRELDNLIQKTSGAVILQYVITLLCDELTEINNKEIQ